MEKKSLNQPPPKIQSRIKGTGDIKAAPGKVFHPSYPKRDDRILAPETNKRHVNVPENSQPLNNNKNLSNIQSKNNPGRPISKKGPEPISKKPSGYQKEDPIIRKPSGYQNEAPVTKKPTGYQKEEQITKKPSGYPKDKEPIAKQPTGYQKDKEPSSRVNKPEPAHHKTPFDEYDSFNTAQYQGTRGDAKRRTFSKVSNDIIGGPQPTIVGKQISNNGYSRVQQPSTQAREQIVSKGSNPQDKKSNLYQSLDKEIEDQISWMPRGNGDQDKEIAKKMHEREMKMIAERDKEVAKRYEEEYRRDLKYLTAKDKEIAEKIAQKEKKKAADQDKELAYDLDMKYKTKYNQKTKNDKNFANDIMSKELAEIEKRDRDYAAELERKSRKKDLSKITAADELFAKREQEKLDAELAKQFEKESNDYQGRDYNRSQTDKPSYGNHNDYGGGYDDRSGKYQYDDFSIPSRTSQKNNGYGNNNNISSYQSYLPDGMTEDEALAKALMESQKDNSDDPYSNYY